MLTAPPQLDRKDLDILAALDKYGAKTSTEELSEILNIPARTVRYRLSKLRERSLLHPPRVQTHERKIGLAENILIVQEGPKRTSDLRKVIDVIPCFYWYAPTYGKYNGYMINSMFSLSTPQLNQRMLEEMSRCGLISDYYIFDLVDYEFTKANFSYFHPEEGWTWDWSEWKQEIKRNLRRKKKFSLKLDRQPRMADYDYKDVLILKYLLEDANITLRKLGKKLKLSDTQVNKRIRRLEKERIIKGYKPIFAPFGDISFITLFLDLEEPIGRILAWFYELPYPIAIGIDAGNRFSIKIGLSARDMEGFFEGFELLRPHIASYFVQFEGKGAPTRHSCIFDLYNKDTNSWKFLIDDYLNKIKELC